MKDVILFNIKGMEREREARVIIFPENLELLIMFYGFCFVVLLFGNLIGCIKGFGA